jgi:hypothetical protein
MKKGNNNSPGPYLVEFWLKGLLTEGSVVKKKVINPNNIKKNKK